LGKVLIICALKAKDPKGAQVTLDALRTQPSRDSVFLEVADKDVIAGGKTLPYRLTPLTPASLALLRLTGLPLPGELFGHPDYGLVWALLHAPAQQDVAQLALAERAAQRGLIALSDLTDIYRKTNFTPDALAAPLSANESGLRQRALLYRAARDEKDPMKRFALAMRFVQVAPLALLNGAGALVADMLGEIHVDPSQSANAAMLARVYMLAGRGDAALEWLKLEQNAPTASADDMQAFWPQFVLAGLQSDMTYAADFDRWFNDALKNAAAQTDRHTAIENVAATLLLMDAAGFKVPDADWTSVMEGVHYEKHFALSPVLFDRLQAAGAGGKRAESIMLSVALAGDADISLPNAVAITRALRQAGFKGEAATFARQAIALLGKSN
jgi:hypothetical protein